METLGLILENTGIYKRKLVFFSAIFLIGFVLWNTVSANFGNIKIAASPEGINNADGSAQFYTKITVLKNGKILLSNSNVAEQAIIQREDYDELRFLVLDQSGAYYQDVQIDVALPKPLVRPPAEPQIIAVHGAEPVAAVLNKTEINYKARNVGSMATVTVVQKFPKGYFEFPINEKASGFINNLPGLFWIIMGLALPAVGVFVILRAAYLNNLILKKTGKEGVSGTMPSKIAPAIASIFLDGKIGPRTIAAILADLARRGYIEIFIRKNDFAIIKKNVMENPSKLRVYEKILLEKIFSKSDNKSNMEIIERKLSDELFSREVSALYSTVYKEAESLGYFNFAPPVTHLQYRITGIVMFLLSFLGFGFFVFRSPEPKFILIFWIALMILGVLLINIAPKLTSYTAKGREARDKWLAFRNFLQIPDDIHEPASVFMEYFPYAVALGVEAQWSARFVDVNFEKPDWYELNRDIAGADGFAQSFLPIINYIGETLSLANDPMVR